MTETKPTTPADAAPPAIDRRHPDPWRASVDDRLEAGQAVMQKLQTDSQAMRDELAANTLATNGIKKDTAEVVDLLHSIKGAFHVLEMLGKLARPMGYIAAAGTAFWSLFSMFKGGGGTPK